MNFKRTQTWPGKTPSIILRSAWGPKSLCIYIVNFNWPMCSSFSQEQLTTALQNGELFMVFEQGWEVKSLAHTYLKKVPLFDLPNLASFCREDLLCALKRLYTYSAKPMRKLVSFTLQWVWGGFALHATNQVLVTCHGKRCCGKNFSAWILFRPQFSTEYPTSNLQL